MPTSCNRKPDTSSIAPSLHPLTSFSSDVKCDLINHRFLWYRFSQAPGIGDNNITTFSYYARPHILRFRFYRDKVFTFWLKWTIGHFDNLQKLHVLVPHILRCRFYRDKVFNFLLKWTMDHFDNLQNYTFWRNINKILL